MAGVSYATMGNTIIGLLLTLPLVFVNEIATKTRHPDAYRRPPIAFSPAGMLTLNIVWFGLLIAVFVFLIRGSGWWTLLLFPCGLIASQIVLLMLVWRRIR